MDNSETDAIAFLEKVRTAFLQSGLTMRGSHLRGGPERLAIHATAVSCAIAPAGIDLSAEMKIRLLERFEAMTTKLAKSGEGFQVPGNMRSAILEELVKELEINHRALKLSPDKLISLTVYNGAVGPSLLSEFPDFLDPHSAFSKAAQNYSSNPRAYLKRVKENIASLREREKFAAFTDFQIEYAAIYYKDPDAYLNTNNSLPKDRLPARVHQAVTAVAGRTPFEDCIPARIQQMLVALSDKEFDKVLRQASLLSREEEFANYTHAEILEAAMQKDPRAFLRGEDDLDDEHPLTERKPALTRKPGSAIEPAAATATRVSNAAISPERNAMLRHAFLESAGITDESKYNDLSVQDCIRQILDNASITLKMIGPSKQAADSRIKNILASAPKSARNLGKLLSPLLDLASKDGRIIRSSAAPDPEWKIKQQAKVRHIDNLLLSDFCAAAGIGNYVPAPSLKNFMYSYCQILNQHAGITYEKLGKNFSPPVKRRYILQRVLEGTNYDKNFVHQLGIAMRPFLIKGAQEGWLDEAKTPKTYERILCEQLEVPYGFLEGKEGAQALLHCIDKSGLTRAAASAIVGQHHLALTKDALKLADVAHMARGIKPYLHGKPWTGILEVTDPTFLKAHLVAKTYVIHKVQALVPSHMAAELDDLLDTLPTSDSLLKNTLGPTLKLLRKHVNLSQISFGQSLTQSDLATYETNCFNPRILDANGELNPTTRKRLDRFAEVVAEKWQSKDASLSSWTGKEAARTQAGRGWQRH